MESFICVQNVFAQEAYCNGLPASGQLFPSITKVIASTNSCTMQGVATLLAEEIEVVVKDCCTTICTSATNKCPPAPTCPFGL
uniref:Uncharacterized protein n=1 Tax=Plectus sambesii TaxID=2011161 RepID=A0A914V5K1_9BILA